MFNLNISALPKLIPPCFVTSAKLEICIVELEFNVFDFDSSVLLIVANTFTVWPA